MAIIYSYPENNNILPSDILVCTSTALINGKPKNQTKNISIADLTAFMALNGNNLNDVLTNGNTSLLNANIGQLGLFDAQAQNYGSLELSSSEFNFYNTSNVLTSTLTSDSLILYPNSYSGQLLVPNTITADRVYTFQDASGIVALTSDLLSYVPYTGATQAVDLGVYSLTAGSIIKAGGTNLQYLLADGSVSTGPVVAVSDLQAVLTAGNTASEDINLTGKITTTDFEAQNDIYVSTLNGDNIRVGRGPGSANEKNIVLGTLALVNNTTGSENMAIGYQALIENTSGSNNLAVGVYALEKNIAGIGNTAIGNQSLVNNLIGTDNVAVGKEALKNSTVSAQTAVGTLALGASTTGLRNTAVGFTSLSILTTANDNTAIGYSTLYNNTNANNSALGSEALFFNTTGTWNTAIGYRALYGNTTAESNTAIGGRALVENTVGSFNTAIGRNALQTNTSGANNVAVGVTSLGFCTSGNDNTAVGNNSLRSTTFGGLNTAIGSGAMFDNTTGQGNAAFGVSALVNNTTGNNNTAIGPFTLFENTTVSNSTAVGHEALRTTNGGTFNTAVGNQSMRSNTTGNSNVAIGDLTMYSTTTGTNNTAVGRTALYANTVGINNTAVGSGAIGGLTSGSDNTVIGTFAMGGTQTGSSNVALGLGAGRYFGTGFSNNLVCSSSIFIGQNAVPLLGSQTNQIVIGTSAVGAGSNTATIGNTSITTTRLRGAVQGGSFVKDGGTSSEYLLADGSVTTSGPSGYKYNFSGSLTLTGTLTTTNLLTITIPASSLSDYLDLRSLMVQQSGPALAGFQIRVWHNSVNDYNTATRIANYSFGGGGADLFAQMTRKFSIQGGTLFGFSSTPSNATGEGSNSNAALSIPFDPTVTNYLFVSVQLNDITDTAILRNVNIIN